MEGNGIGLGNIGLFESEACSTILPSQVCRWIPWTINNYKLDELTTAQELRSNLSFMFKQQAHIKNPRVVDILIYKGREELEVSSAIASVLMAMLGRKSESLKVYQMLTS